MTWGQLREYIAMMAAAPDDLQVNVEHPTEGWLLAVESIVYENPTVVLRPEHPANPRPGQETRVSDVTRPRRIIFKVA